jgi:hypothetical protein
MKNARFFGVHRNWEDWLRMLLGIATSLSPWISGQMGSQSMMFNAFVVGLMLFMFAQFEAANLHRWKEGCVLLLGVWLGVSPFIFGYSAAGSLRYWHFAFAAIAIVLAAVELWQEWNLTDEELAEHEN